MDEAAADAADGASDATADALGVKGMNRTRVMDIAEKGDIILDLTFENSAEALRKMRKTLHLPPTSSSTAASTASSSSSGNSSRKSTPNIGAQTPPAPTPALQPKVRVAFRVSLDALKKHSKYFSNLLSNSSFHEAQIIAKAHKALAEIKVSPTEASANDLPWVQVSDDDEATRAAGRELVFEDMLRILHSKPARNASRMNMTYVATMAITADRFDCVSVVSRALNGELKFKWPLTNMRPLRDDLGRMTDAETILRQKILVAWLLAQPMRLAQAARELIMRGSCLWSALFDAAENMTAAWWSLPDGLEHELQYRRECILNTIASVQRHFIGLYSSKERQCKLGYDSSGACDSFQLGQFIKFLCSKSLLFLIDFSPSSLDTLPDTALIDIDELLTTLKQCPHYQVDKHHTNCGPRIRMEPILEYLRAMLSAGVVTVAHADWKRRRLDVSWVVSRESRGQGLDGNDEEGETRFAFTRALANDARLRVEGALYVDKMAKRLFTADTWEWTPEA